jgi:hypothetical protein
VELLVIGLEPLEDLDRVGHRRLVDVDLLEAPDQRPVLLEVLAVLLVGGRADAAQGAAGERGLEQVGGVHRPAAGGAGTDHGVDLVDEHDGAGIVLDLLDDRLDALLEVAAVAGAGEQRAHVELEDGAVAQHRRHVALDDLARQAFRDGRLADARIADVKRVVLLAPAQDLDGAVDLRGAPDQRVDAALVGLVVEVDAVGGQRFADAAVGAGGLLLLLALRLGAAHGAGLGHAGALGDAVRDVVDRVVARHVLLLQEIGGMALALGEDGDQHVGAGDLLAARRLHMDDGALDDALEAGGRLGVAAPVGHQVRQFGVDIGLQVAAQHVDVDAARPQHRGRIEVVDERQQQVLQRGVFVAALVGQGERPVKSLF